MQNFVEIRIEDLQKSWKIMEQIEEQPTVLVGVQEKVEIAEMANFPKIPEVTLHQAASLEHAQALIQSSLGVPQVWIPQVWIPQVWMRKDPAVPELIPTPVKRLESIVVEDKE